MAFVAPGLIQGLAAGFGGDSLLTDLALRKLQLRAGQQQEQAAEESQSANKVWSRAIMDVLAGSSQNPQITPPQSPAPGQASVPMTQGAGMTPASPGMAAPQPPGPTMAMLSGQPVQPQQQPATPGGPPTPTFSQLNVANILADIQKKNPSLPDGVLSSVVNDHILPLLSAQDQQQYKNFQQQIEYLKLDQTQQDKMDTLYFKYQQLQEQMDNAAANRQDRMILGEAMLSIKQEMATIVAPYYQARAEAEANRAKTAKGAEKFPQGSPQRLQYDQLKNKYNSLSRLYGDAESAGDSDRMTLLQTQMDDTQSKMDELLSGAPKTPDAGAAGGAATDSIKLSTDHLSDPDGTEYTKDGKTYVKQGDVAVPK